MPDSKIRITLYWGEIILHEAHNNQYTLVIAIFNNHLTPLSIKGNDSLGYFLYSPWSFGKAHDFICPLADHAADLGFTLHGGNDNPCFPGDPGIFIKHVVSGSSADSMLRPWDRVLSVSSNSV